jgi:uncharacterized membrane protein
MNNKNNLFPKIILGALAAVGLGIMIYLTYLHYAHVQSFCDISETISCDAVTKSIYSKVFGIPVAILGILYFAAMLTILIFNEKKNLFLTVFLTTIFVIIPSLYLTAIEIFAIKSFCILCESSKIVMLLILGISFIEAKRLTKITWRPVMLIIIAGLLASVVTYFIQTGLNF